MGFYQLLSFWGFRKKGRDLHRGGEGIAAGGISVKKSREKVPSAGKQLDLNRWGWVKTLGT